MSVSVGRQAVIKMNAGAENTAAASCVALTGVVSWSIDAAQTIDATVAGDTFSRMVNGLEAGMITAEIIDDGDAQLIEALTESLAGDFSSVHFYIDGGTTPVYSWNCLLTGSLTTGGPNDVVRRTIQFYRQSDIAS